ncbi:MAG: ABC-F family ATP-binding cassette domain-containing protein, partial [Paracoccaceae bacterium]
FSGFATLGEFAANGLEPRQDYRVERAGEGLKLALDMAPDKASGGERRRAALVRIIAREPDLMLLDEPTNHLDIEAIEWLEDHLATRRGGFVLISHDRAFLGRLARATLWLDRGVLRRLDRGFGHFEAWRDKVFEDEDLAQHKLGRKVRAEARWAVEGISARRKRNQGRVRRLAALREERAARIRRPGTAKLVFEGGASSGRLVVEAKGVAKSFGATRIVRDFSLRIQRGERIALVGPNGAGKTTLVNLLMKTLAPDQGSVRHGTGLAAAVFDQSRADLDEDATLWETLTGDRALGMSSGVSGRNDQVMVRGRPRHVVGYLKDYLFDEAQVRGPVRVLSGGEKARLLLARLMARESNILVLDEPTNDLDVETLDLLQEVLDSYEGTVLLVSHDRDFLDRVATTTIAAQGDGRWVVYAGGWSDYRAQRDAPRSEGGSTRKPAAKPKAEKPARSAAPKKVSGLSFVELHRLGELPGEIERIEAEIARLQAFLSDADLYRSDPSRFTRASNALISRQTLLGEIEEEWMDLESRA